MHGANKRLMGGAVFHSNAPVRDGSALTCTLFDLNDYAFVGRAYDRHAAIALRVGQASGHNEFSDCLDVGS